MQETMGIGTEDGKHKKLSGDDLQNMFMEQSYSDGLLEMTVMQTLLDLAMDHCKRIGQAAGPFEIKFNDQGDSESVNYVQIDGEFFKCKNLKSIKFSLTPNLNNGSVMCRERNTFEEWVDLCGS